MILEPVKKRGWPRGYWQRLDCLREGLDIPDVEPLGGGLLDLDVDGG